MQWVERNCCHCPCNAVTQGASLSPCMIINRLATPVPRPGLHTTHIVRAHEILDRRSTKQPDRQSRLTQNGAVVDHGAVQHFGDPAHEGRAVANGPCIADLSHQAVIRAYGADTGKFLQGQLTNDICQLDGSRSQLSAYCSPKGRALAIMRLFRRGEAYCLLLPASLLEPTLNRLRKYVLMS